MFKYILCNKSRLSGLCFALISLLFFTQIDNAAFKQQLIPVGCLLVMLLAAVIELLSARRETASLSWAFAAGRGLLIFGGYLAVIYLFGFFIATPLFTAAVFYLMSPTGKSVLTGLIFGVLLAGLTYLLFVVAMGNLLPEGILLAG